MGNTEIIISSDTNGSNNNDSNNENDSVENNINESDNESDNDGITCGICFDYWTSNGPHRICSLRCGHLFGKR